MNSNHLVKLELAKLNAHLPDRRISLGVALSSPKPQVLARDGNVHSFKREELDLLARLMPETDWRKLQLPILISLEPKLGRGAARISDKFGAVVACKLLGKETTEGLLIYRPEVASLRRKLPTTTQYIFVG